MRKYFITFLSVTSLLLVPPVIYAQVQPGTNSTTQNPSTTTTVSTVMSDYALDVQQGKQFVNNDVDVQRNQKDVADNENIQAQEGTEAVEPVEKVEPQEAVEPKEVENETEGEKSGGDTSSEGSKQESGSNSDAIKQSGSENKQTDSEKSGKNVEGAHTYRGYQNTYTQPK